MQLNLVESCLSEEQKHHLRNLALQGYPNEVCGVVFAHGIIVQYPNVAADPQHSFDAEVDISDPDIRAIWHSHPHPGGPEHPSDDDMDFIYWCERHGLKFHHIIVTPRTINEYAAKSVALSGRVA